jgi:hypothetical protein
MSVLAAVVTGDDDAQDRPVSGPTGASFIDALVVRLHAEYGGDREEIRVQLEAARATFASARVQTFVPILVEKRLHEAYRGRP